jgi:ATP synthase protein I
MKHIKSFQYFVLLTQIGLNLALPIVGGVYVGAYLDKRFSSGSFFLILGLLLGVIGGISGIIRILSHDLKKK